MEISISELREIANSLFDHLEKQGQKKIDIPYDFYWNIVQKQRYDSYTEPKDFTIGQISDDWRELSKIRERKSDPIGYGLVWLSSVIRCIGETVKI